MLLALDTATATASLALYELTRDTLVAEWTWQARRRHTQDLLGAAQTLLHQAGATPAALTALAVTTGPGSFTGVRIGISTVKGMALGLKIVEDRDGGRTGGTRDALPRDDPGKVRHLGAAILDRAGGGDAGPGAARNAQVRQVIGQDRFQPRPPGVRIAADRCVIDAARVCQCDAGIRAADIGEDQGVGRHRRSRASTHQIA